MAGCRGNIVVVGLLTLAVVASAVRPVKQDPWCRPSAENVYPLGSSCQGAARLGVDYHYVATGLQATGAKGGMEPEWDDSNSTYYLRFTGDFSNAGAHYMATLTPPWLSHDAANRILVPLRVNDTVYIFNAENGRALRWRQEGSHEFFLVEQQIASISDAAPFRFLLAEDVAVPCILPLPPVICNAYYLVSDPAPSSGYTDAGLLAYPEDGAIYIKAAPAGSVGDLPIFVITPSTTNMPDPAAIRTVTD